VTLRVPLGPRSNPSTPAPPWEFVRGQVLRWVAEGDAHLERAGVPLDLVSVAALEDHDALLGLELVIADPLLEAQFRQSLDRSR
jgi:hypothetical protein